MAAAAEVDETELIVEADVDVASPLSVDVLVLSSIPDVLELGDLDELLPEVVVYDVDGTCPVVGVVAARVVLVS